MKKALSFAGLVFLISCTTMFIAAFTLAFLSPEKSVLVAIDNYGEAVLEAVLILFLLPLGIYSTWDMIRHLRMEAKA